MMRHVAKEGNGKGGGCATLPSKGGGLVYPRVKERPMESQLPIGIQGNDKARVSRLKGGEMYTIKEYTGNEIFEFSFWGTRKEKE